MARALNNGYCEPEEVDRVQHVCNLCKDLILEVTVPSLLHRTEDMRFTRKYPFREGTLLCPPCRVNQQIPDKALLVEIHGNEDWEVALQRKLDMVRRLKASAASQKNET